MLYCCCTLTGNQVYSKVSFDRLSSRFPPDVWNETLNQRLTFANVLFRSICHQNIILVLRVTNPKMKRWNSSLVLIYKPVRILHFLWNICLWSSWSSQEKALSNACFAIQRALWPQRDATWGYRTALIKKLCGGFIKSCTCLFDVSNSFVL